MITTKFQIGDWVEFIELIEVDDDSYDYGKVIGKNDDAFGTVEVAWERCQCTYTENPGELREKNKSTSTSAQ